jgi:thymidylate synthase (FAD)
MTTRNVKGDDSQSSPCNSTVSTESSPTSRLHRSTVAALDDMLGMPLHILDAGFIRVIDYMGDDSSVVQAARVSYGAGTKRVQEDRALIRYLLRHSHTTPFEMCEIKLHVKAPMDVWRQWIRHRTASVNEYSTRYSVAIDGAQTTPAGEWRLQSSENKQGSTGFVSIPDGERLSVSELEIQRATRKVYEARLAAGVAREQARKDLPLSTYTEAYWKIDLHNLLHFLDLRMDSHAQQEIRSYALAIGEQIVARWVPIVWEAFLDYRRHSVQLSYIEAEVIRALIADSPECARSVASAKGLLVTVKSGRLAPNRERSELESKLRMFGLTPPWE